MKVLTSDQMRQVDRNAESIGLTTEILMENAGRAVAEETSRLVGDVIGKNILVLIGPGNNGGDGLVAARYLEDFGADVCLYLCTNRSTDDKNFKLIQERNMNIINAEQDKNFSGLDKCLATSEAVIDAIFGTGRSRTIEGLFKQVMNRVIAAKE